MGDWYSNSRIVKLGISEIREWSTYVTYRTKDRVYAGNKSNRFMRTLKSRFGLQLAHVELYRVVDIEEAN